MKKAKSPVGKSGKDGKTARENKMNQMVMIVTSHDGRKVKRCTGKQRQGRLHMMLVEETPKTPIPVCS